MDELDILSKIKNHRDFKADFEIWNKIESRIKTQEHVPLNASGRKQVIFRYAFVASFAVVALTTFAVSQLSLHTVNTGLLITHSSANLVNSHALSSSSLAVVNSSAKNSASVTVSQPSSSVPKQSAVQNPIAGGTNIKGPLIWPTSTYFKYMDIYYKKVIPEYYRNVMDHSDSANDFADIQTKIVKNIGGNFYEIEGSDPSKSLAIYLGGYYYRINYAFSDTVSFNGNPYLISMNIGKVGKSLGKVGGFDAYELSGSDTSNEIVVKIESFNANCIAYQILSSVSFNGQTYYLKANESNIDSHINEKYIGKSGPYDAYSYEGKDPSQSIVVHVNSSQEVEADLFITTVGTPPKSIYNSIFYTMYTQYASTKWKTHGIYIAGDSSYMNTQTQETYNSELGQKLGTDTIGGINYDLYEIKGIDSSQAIFVKNNQVLIRYYFAYPDIITFNGAKYTIGSISDSGVNYSYGIRGEQIGTAGSYKVYCIKNVDPAKAIIAYMIATSGTIAGSGGTETLIRMN
jgi:hypothetical protein